MILLHAYAQALRTGMPNPKTFPHWPALLEQLALRDVIQIGVKGDVPLVKDFREALPLREIRRLVEQCDWWLTIDSFLPHLAQHVGKPGVVLWSKSDPRIFGYEQNLNLLKDRRYLRAKQFRIWEEESYDPEAFVSPGEAATAIQAWVPRVMKAREASRSALSFVGPRDREMVNA